MLSLPRVRVTRQPRTDPAILGGVRALVPLLIPVAMIFSAPWVGAENADWSLLQKAFKDTWKIDGLENAGLRSKLRARKRAAVKGLRKAHDARAVPVLMGAHKKQLKFIGRLEKQWAKRRAAWEKLQPAMEKALQAKQKTAGPDGNIRVTPGEKAWIDERMRLDNLRRSISNEEEIAEYTRKAMARICNTVEGKEAGRALAPILKAAGDGTKPDQREFIRVLGHVQGEAATAALEGLAAALRPVVAATALRALGRQNAPRSVTTLLARLDDPRWQLRVASLEGLSFFKDARVVDALLARLPSEDGVLRRHYYTALSRILDETLPTTIEAWASWWKANRDRVVKRWAEKADGLPIPDDLPAVALKSEGNSDSTSFYGLKTESKHIIFVIDVSGSMGEQGGVTKDGKMRIDIAKRELKNAIRSLSATEHDERGAASFNVVAYAADVRVFKEGRMVVATKANKERVFKWIDDLRAIGATNIFDALEQAFLIIGTRKAKKQFEKGADTIFLMTDGKPNRGKVMDPVLIRKEIRKMNRERKLTIHTIGVGENVAEGFLKKLASENGGEYLAR